MPPVIVSDDLDIESEVRRDGFIQIDFLLPNGLFIPLDVDFYASVDSIKQDLWKNAERLPLYKQLKTASNYNFVYINHQGQKDEVLDEDLSLNDLRPSAKFLKLVEKQGDPKKRTLDRQTKNLIGSKGLTYIEEHNDPEIDDFKSRMEVFCYDLVCTRNHDTSGWLNFEYKHPPRLRTSPELPDQVQKKLKDGNIVLTVKIRKTGASFMLRISANSFPCHLVDMTLNKWASKTGERKKSSTDYILKVIGMEDYLYRDYPLKQFKYVYTCLLRNVAPEFWLMGCHELLEQTNSSNAEIIRPQRSGSSFNSQSTPNLHSSKSVRRPDRDKLVWDVEQKFQLTVQGIDKIEIQDGSKVKLFAGLYHGPELLVICNTADKTVQDSQCFWKELLTFDLAVQDLPHMCRLCFALHVKKGKETTLLAWVNIPVFDFKSRLLKGEYVLPMWPRQDFQHMDDSCYPIGTVSINPQGKNTSNLTFTVPDFNHKHGHILYPSIEKVLQCANDNMEEPGVAGSPNWRPSKTHVAQLRKILEESGTTTYQLAEQDKDLCWLLRYECRDNYPYALPMLLSSVKWDKHVDVAKMQALLQTWNKLPVDQALELLDFNFPDHHVRKYSTVCLEELSDDEVSQYMLQLVQALKYESHLYCPLVKFLVSRALKNQHLGHQMFWLMKSEMHEPSVTVRFRLIIEVYLKASHDHLSVLSKQQEALTKLEALSAIAKNATQRTNKPKKVVEELKNLLQQKPYTECLTGLFSPLTPLYKLDFVLIDKFKVMDSKKKPLWIRWKNADEEGQDIPIIYKNGDDLRQDMLTLQILQLMDNIWKSEGLDLRLNAYGCIATGREEGMIEVVKDSTTIASIQKWKNFGAFAKEALFEWLRFHNRTEEELNRAVEEFTLSCCGYAVATYILGIGDRHNDNIMLKQSGELFHIDFGHFLGNFKSKMKIKRERVPFILTEHFKYVITKGGTKPENFLRFQQVCEDSYLIIRRKGPLLMRLFMMMLQSGIPQLMSDSDVDYLKDTLALSLTDEEALNKFRQKFEASVRKNWTTNINWAIHNLAH